MWRLIFLVLPFPTCADTLIATQVIPAHAIVTAEDIAVVAADIPDTLSQPEMAIGQEARITLFAGRPIRVGDLGPGAKVERNQIIPLAYQAGPLAILTEGRALERGAEGDVIQVMNLSSRTTVFGKIDASGTARVTSQN